MSAAGVSEQSAEAGFSLIEVLVALALMGLLLSLSVLPLKGVPAQAQLGIAAGELKTALVATRSAAIMHNKSIALSIDVEEKTFASDIVSKRFFASEIAGTLIFAAETERSPSKGKFVFFPDGSATGGRIVLSVGGQEATICVDWLTGMVRQNRSCS